MSQKLLTKTNRKVFVTQQGVFVAHEKDDILGRGTYGVVYRAHLETNPSVKKAVKIFSPDTMDEAEGIPSTTLREINALKTIIHPNVMTAEEVVIPDNRSPTDMFFVMELCKGTLKDKVIELIKKHLNSDSMWLNPSPELKLPEEYVQEVKLLIWQLLNSLAVVHSRGVMHRDLKPVNILWGYDDLLKLADFGLARFVRGNQNTENAVLQQTGEVQTMWYRAPEVLLGDERYGLLVDDWSLGCVIAELFRFRRNSSGRVEPAPLFQGRSDIGTLMIIFETLGTPQPKSIQSHQYLGKLRYWDDEYPKWMTKTLKSRIPLLDPLGHDLLENLLKLSPTERKAARFLLDHPWFDDIKDSLTSVVPWYRGFEDDYKRMIAVDRLPLPRTLKEVSAAQQREQMKQQQRAAAKILKEPSTEVSQCSVLCNHNTNKETTHQADNCEQMMSKTKYSSKTSSRLFQDEKSKEGPQLSSRFVLLGSTQQVTSSDDDDKVERATSNDDMGQRTQNSDSQDDFTEEQQRFENKIKQQEDKGVSNGATRRSLSLNKRELAAKSQRKKNVEQQQSVVSGKISKWQEMQKGCGNELKRTEKAVEKQPALSQTARSRSPTKLRAAGIKRSRQPALLKTSPRQQELNVGGVCGSQNDVSKKNEKLLITNRSRIDANERRCGPRTRSLTAASVTQQKR